MKYIHIILLAMLSAANTSFAASFDCAKAGTKVEKMLCSDPELSKLDEDLSAAYSKALNASANPAALKQQQRGWMKERNKCHGVDCLMSSYKKRIMELNTIQEEKKAAGVEVVGETYALVMSKNDDMCNHMTRLMNDDLRQGGRTYDSNDRFVSSQEIFKAVPWESITVTNEWEGQIDTWKAEGALFDLNNDSELEFVVRERTMLSGIRLDALYILNQSLMPEDGSLEARRLSQAENKIRMDQLMYPLSKPLEERFADIWLLSPFEYKGESYIYIYICNLCTGKTKLPQRI